MDTFPTDDNKRQELVSGNCRRAPTTTSRRGSYLWGGRGPWGFLKLIQSSAGVHTSNTEFFVGPRVSATPPLWFSRLMRHKGSKSINQDAVLRHLSHLSRLHGDLAYDDTDKSTKTGCGWMWQLLNHLIQTKKSECAVFTVDKRQELQVDVCALLRDMEVTGELVRKLSARLNDRTLGTQKVGCWTFIKVYSNNNNKKTSS